VDQFEGKVAVITGGGSGFGREFAIKGASLGMKLVLADIDPNALAETVEMLSASGAEALGVPTDVADATQVDALAKTTLDTFGAVHLLFNNAGVGAGGFVWENSANDWRWVFGVNVMGVARRSCWRRTSRRISSTRRRSRACSRRPRWASTTRPSTRSSE
jgi:NAD(P)-dependent dehydrogenase (short-subunit alcohol dehydrogenase family)